MVGNRIKSQITQVFDSDLQLLTERNLGMDVDFACPNCAKQYKDENPPRLLTCGHTYCQTCIATLAEQSASFSVVCPQDNLTNKFSSNIEQFPKNIALIRLIEGNKKNSSNNSSESLKESFFDVSKINKEEQCQEDQDAVQLISAIQHGSDNKQRDSPIDVIPKSQPKAIPAILPMKMNQSKKSQKKPETQLCLLHQRPVEVVCMKDFQRLCSKCALFGQHKGHQFKSLEEIERQNRKSYQEIVTVFEQKQKLMEHITSKVIQKEIIAVLDIKTINLRKQISQKFKKLAEELAKAERNINKKLDQANANVIQRIQNGLQLDKQLLGFYECWELKALEIFKVHEKQAHEGQIKFYLEGSQIFMEGKELMSQLQKTQNCAQLESLKIIQDFTVRFDQSEYHQVLNNLAIVCQQGKEQEKTNEESHRRKQNEYFLPNSYKKNKIQSHQSDQSLLQFGQLETESMAGSMSNSQILNESFISTKDQIITKRKENPNRISAIKSKTAFVTKEKTNNNNELVNSSAISRQDMKKKLKSLKVPEKYEKVLEGIVNDSLETVDLTNAQLGDAQVFKILDLMKGNTKVKTVKLIRNKLTDQGVASILPFLSNIMTINLSQNQLTENTLSIIADNKCNMRLLKTVVLSQTKIVERKSKAMIQRLKKMQISISV